MPRKGSNKLDCHRDYIITKYNSGVGATSIAKELGCGQYAVLNLLRLNGVEIRASKAERVATVEDINNFEFLYNAENSVYKIAQLTGFSNLTICRHLRNRGYDVSDGQKKRDDPLKNHSKVIIGKYNSGIGIHTIAKEYNASQTSVGDIIRKAGIDIRGQETYSLDESYFEIVDNENKAYWLGFLYADGGLQTKGAITLCITDLDGCQKLKTDLEYEGPIAIVEPKNSNHKTQYSLKINRIKVMKDLLALGCYFDKSFILKFPTSEQVPSHLIKYFIKGYFDGDGSVFKDKNGKWGINFIGCEPLIKGVVDFVLKETSIKFSWVEPTNCNQTKENKIIHIMFGGKFQVFKFLDWLYKDSQVHLDRKYSLYKQLESELVTES